MTYAPMRLGLISAMHEEQAGLIHELHDKQTLTRGMRDYVSGKLWGTDCVCVLSRLGKVAAAATAATVIERFDVTHIVFTGVAGAADAQVTVGDIVVADTLVQHDMDASPLFPRFEIPLLGRSHFASDVELTTRLLGAAAAYIELDLKQTVSAEERLQFKITTPRVHRGLIASGDEFIDCRHRLTDVKTALGDVLAVEMEGAAVAQVCYEFGVPFAVIRTISDSADETSPIDFTRFIERVAAQYAFNIVKRLCNG